MARLAGKVALITGAAQGIGKGTALLFAKEGARVAVIDVDVPHGEETVAQIKADGGDAFFLECDVAVEANIQRMVEETVRRYGKLDVLFNNAYWNKPGTVVELDSADWDRALNVMCKAVYLGCKYAIPEMVKAGGGSIITTASVHGLLAAAKGAAYETAKAAVINLMREVAVDFGHQGIRANAICPGWIVTEKGEARVRENPESVTRAEHLYPAHRPGRPIDIAYGALYLASDESSFVTGTALVIDGGLTCQLQDSLIYRMEPYYRELYGRSG
ncbi:MAG TPA: glucose 1-dehydrogenase [Chloroflexota bacterium]|nr:glucose 1-dehydrogenase [Chloroflexota bacterium]